MGHESVGGMRSRFLLIPALLLLAVGLGLAAIAGAEGGETVRGGVYGPDTCDNQQQVVDTKITKAPKGKTKSTKATIEFAGFFCSTPDDKADQDLFEFTCKLDKGKDESCESPVKLKKLKKGKHVFGVTASYAAVGGSFDPSPAEAKWKVVD